jgi:hypothetical protein
LKSTSLNVPCIQSLIKDGAKADCKSSIKDHVYVDAEGEKHSEGVKAL